MNATTLLLTLSLLSEPQAAPAVAPVATVAAPSSTIEVLPTEIDAVGWAFAAMVTKPESDWPYTRFVWLPPHADPEWLGAVDFAVNSAAGHGRQLIRGERHAGGWLVSYDLRLLAPDPAILARLIVEWDNLATRDSVFHVSEVNLVETTAPATTDRLGRTIPGAVTKQERKSSLLAPHLRAALAKHATDESKSERVDVLLARMTGSGGSIYPADFLIEQLLTSLRGRYPEFRQIDFSPDAAQGTPLQQHLKKRGFFFETATDRGGERGSVMLISEVTGKNRLVLAIPGLASRIPATITFDFADATTRPDKQFIRNLIGFDQFADASELLIPLPNGLIEYVLADGKGAIQRAAPPNVVADHTKPSPGTTELEMGMSCVVCHASEDGFRKVRNDLELLLGSSADFFGGSISYTNRYGQVKSYSAQQALDVVVGRFTEPLESPDGVLPRARRDFISSVDRITDYEVKADGPSPVAAVSAKIRDVQYRYRYGRIDADRACLELGVRVPAGQGRSVLAKLVPASPAGQSEDVVIALLRNGAEINRDFMAAIYPEMARRAAETRDSLKTASKGVGAKP